MSLAKYRDKRRFESTAEPRGESQTAKRGSAPVFVIQKHAATRLHYDFRLELDGVLKSWAVPNGPSLDPQVKALAVQVEDHPLEYATFEGTIPKGEYGGGTVMLWDRGTWSTDEKDAVQALKRGKITFEVSGEKLHGGWTLVRMGGRDSENWLLIKRHDQYAEEGSGHQLLEDQPRSVASQRTMNEIADNQPASHRSKSTARVSKSSRAPAKKRSAVAARAPEKLSPQLAKLVEQPPTGDQWVHEIKLDGYRILARFDNQQVTLWTRSGLDWTNRFPHVVRALERLKLDQTWLDGEIVVQNPQGITNFQLLQNALSREDDSSIIYFVFDLPWYQGQDLTSQTLLERKQTLELALDSSSSKTISRYVRFHEHLQGSGRQVRSSACELKLEGIVSKRIDSPYQSQRTASWQKSKCHHVEEFIIAGYTKPQGQRHAFGALLLGSNRDDELIYCGRVGTGFTEATLTELNRRFKQLSSEDCPFARRPTTAQLRGVHWLRPELVAQISYATRTNDGLLRHAVFHGLREDMPAHQVGKEKFLTQLADSKKGSHLKKSTRTKLAKAATKPIAPRTVGSTNKSSVIEVSHPERVVYPDLGLTKADVVRYFEEISPWLLPGVIGRPLSVLRCPQGIEGDSFYQKHFEDHLPPGVFGVDIQEEKKTTTYATIKNSTGLVALAQWNVIELHPWPALAKQIEHPDRLIFDLDPGDGVSWDSVIRAAREVRRLLSEVELECFVRTSGGKGLHIVTPLQPGSVTWDELKQFAKLLAQTLAKQHPDRITATLSKASRRGKIFVDYLRNGRGATAVASYCPRARPGANVAMPLRWKELSEKATNNRYAITNVIKLLKSRRTPAWEGFDELKQKLPDI